MKKLSFFTLIELALAAITISLLLIFAVIVARNNVRQSSLEKELLDSIDNAVTVCDSYAEKINIEENLRDDLDIYISNIKNEKSVPRKAYYARIMLTYTQNRVNMNDPQTLFELAQELGDNYTTSSAEIAAYKSYITEITEAFSRFNAAYEAYTNFRPDKGQTTAIEID
ncbi:MAG: hypothetical protein J6A07_06545 [Firmicutes bacterium]|nr:hypothetical protein [Bacillota bacterium]